MKSMTGYGFGEVQEDSFVLSAEVKSYNNRFLEIVHAMPALLNCFESGIDQKVKTVASRGRVEVNIKFKVLSSTVQISVNQSALEQYRGALDTIEKSLGRKAVFSFSDLAAVDDLISEKEENDPQRFAPALNRALDLALAQFEATKNREGEATRQDLLRQLDSLNDNFTVVKDNAAELERVIRENLISRFNEMLGDKGFDESRFLQEVAVMLVKYSINEEICRLTSHIAEAYRLVNGDEPCGKRLDFLSQEMNREINTIGSKNIMVPISQKVVVMKDNLENIREQMRNIE